MDSRFKFVKSVDPTAVQASLLKPKFGKLTLATTKTTTVEATDLNRVRKTTETIIHATKTTTTTTTMAGRENEFNQKPSDAAMPNEQKPKLLLYESTILHATTIDKDADPSDLLTDDDTDSVRSSIDSSELEEGLKNVSQTQPSVINIESIDSQMQILNVNSQNDNGEKQKTERTNADLINISTQLKHLDISQVESSKINQSNYSIQSLSSTETIDKEQSANKTNPHGMTGSDDVIILSDSESEKSYKGRRVSQEPPLKYNDPPDNDKIAFNASSNEPRPMSSFAMQQVNQFFDNIPYTEACENSFNSTLLSKSLKEAAYVSETSIDESSEDIQSAAKAQDIVEESPNRPAESEKIVNRKSTDTESVEEENKLEFSGNNIVLDIPVVKSSSDQPHQLVRSQSGLRLTAFNSTPIIKPSTAVTTTNTASNVVLKKTGSSITVNSSNGQVEISAKININIHISPAEDSSSDTSSERNVPSNKPQITQATPKKTATKNKIDTPKMNGTPKMKKVNKSTVQDSADVPKSARGECEQAAKNKTPRPHKKPVNDSNLDKSPKDSAKKRDILNAPATPKTPSTASKLKTFEYVAPKSMTKSTSKSQKQKEMRNEETHNTDDSTENELDGFKVDENIPISPKNQELLYKVYGNAWKTPEVIRSYSAIKGKPNNAANPRSLCATDSPSVFKASRYSKGFHMFKRNISDKLNSTRLEECAEGVEAAEISIIEPAQPVQMKSTSKPVQSIKTCDKDTESARIEPLSAKKATTKTPSQSVINKDATSKPSENEKSAKKRPQRNARKRILYSFDESDDDKENSYRNKKDSGSDEQSSGLSYSSDIMTDDDSDSDFSARSGSTTRGKSTTKPTKKTTSKKNDDKKLIYLDLSSEEVVEVNENFHTEVAEEDLINMTRNFFEADTQDNKPKKKTGRKLFTPQYDDIDEISPEKPMTVRKKIPQSTLIEDIEIPRFTQTKLFDSKRFGSPSLNKTPEIPSTPRSKTIASQKSASKLEPIGTPRTFTHYGFLKSLDVQSSMLFCHPEARKFRENFKANRDELTQTLYKMFNNNVFDGKLDVDIIWNKKLTTTAGRFICKSKGKCYIDLSDKVLTSADRLRCTLIHEMCHAATWILSKKKDSHGPVWKGWAQKANKIFPELPIITTCHNYDIEYKYTYKCDMCQNKSHSHTKNRKVENIRCSLCHGMISIYLNKKQKDGNIEMVPVRQATGFSKFVKEFYKVHKKPGTTHVDVMQILSAEFAKLSSEEKKKY